MSDTFFPIGKLPIKAIDNGDGTYSISTSGGGGGGGADRELSITTYRANKNFTGATTGNLITATRMIDVSGTEPTQVGDTVWRNETTNTVLAGAPLAADIDLATGGGGATNAEMTVLIEAQTAAIKAGVIATGNVADNATDSGNAIKVAGINKTARPTYGADSRVPLHMDTRGNLFTSISSGTDVAVVSPSKIDAMPNTTVSLATTGYGFVYNGTNWDRMRGSVNGLFMQGNVASAVADAGNPLKLGAVYSNAQIPVATGQRTNLYTTLHGSLLVAQENGAGLSDSMQAYATIGRNGSDLLFGSANMVYDGSNYLRMRGGLQGVMMQGGTASGSTDAGNPVKIGGVYSVTPANISDGQRGNIRIGFNGAVIQSPNFGATAAADTNNNNVVRGVLDNGNNQIIQLVGSVVHNGTTWDRMRGDTTGLAVNVLKAPLVARKLTVSGTTAEVALTGGCKRVSIYNRGTDTRFVIANATGGTVNNATDHFIAAGERLEFGNLDISVGATPFIKVIRDSAVSADGELNITELS
jgi:hypothetical protein